jgi:hypothetical protein
MDYNVLYAKVAVITIYNIVAWIEHWNYCKSS